MEEENRRSGWKLWVYLIPVYVLVAIPLIKWTLKVNSGDVNLSNDEYAAFNSPEGEIKKNTRTVYTPELTETDLSIHYRSGNAPAPRNSAGGRAPAGAKKRPPSKANEAAPRPAGPKKPAGGEQQPPAAQARNVMKEREQKSFGFTKGYLTYAVGKTMNNPKAVGALFNNSFVVGGFMARDTVKSALGSTQGLKNYLSNTAAVNGFLENGVVKAALANPQIVNTVASSSLVAAMINSPAIQDLIKNPESLNQLIASNPQIATLMANPNILNALTNNPQTAGALGGLNAGGGYVPGK